MTVEKPQEKTQTDQEILQEVQHLTDQEIRNRIQNMETNMRLFKQQSDSINHEISMSNKNIKEYRDKIKMNKQLPWLVSSVVEILDIQPQVQEDEQVQIDALQKISGKAVVIRTTTRNTIFLPPSQLKPSQLVGVNKDSYILFEKLPAEYDTRVRAMQIDDRPSEQYTDIGGLDKQIQELREAIVLPITHKDKFKNIGIRPPKGCLMHGPPGTGKTMMARACAAQTKATFLKLAGPDLVQMFIGEGAKMVRDAFALAKQKQPAIIFIDELDAIGTKRFDSQKSGDREVQRTMLQLLNQLDGFSPNDDVKVIAATNRPDILDPALLRSGRLDRKIEFPLPNEESRVQILKIHSRKMNVSKQVNFVQIARSMQDFNGAQVKAVTVQAGMNALRRGGQFVVHEDYVEGIGQVQAKKKSNLNYYA